MQLRRFSCIMSTSEERNWKVILLSQIKYQYLPCLPAQPALESQGKLTYGELLFTWFGSSYVSMLVLHRYGDCVCPQFERGVFNSILIIQKYFHLTDNLNDPIKAAITIRTNPALIDSHVSSQSLAPNSETRKILPFLSSFLHFYNLHPYNLHTPLITVFHLKLLLF